MLTVDTPLADIFPSRWLKPRDLTSANVSQIVTRCTRVTVEEVTPRPSEPPVQRVALHLAGWKPYLITTKADAAMLTRYGAATPAQLVGKTVAIKLDVWRKQAVLRIAPPPQQSQPAKPAS